MLRGNDGGVPVLDSFRVILSFRRDRNCKSIRVATGRVSGVDVRPSGPDAFIKHEGVTLSLNAATGLLGTLIKELLRGGGVSSATITGRGYGKACEGVAEGVVDGVVILGVRLRNRCEYETAGRVAGRGLMVGRRF